MTITSQIGMNLWSTGTGTANSPERLQGNDFNDVLHAVHNNVYMNGSAGGDHFHIKAGVKNTTIQDFRFGEGDLIVLDGITNIDPSKFTVAKTGQADYSITYDNTTFNIQDLRQGNGELWDISAEKLKSQLANKYVRLGQVDADADYFYGFSSISNVASGNNANRIFTITGERPVYISGFSADQNRHKLDFKLNGPTGAAINAAWNEHKGAIELTYNNKIIATLTPPKGTQSLGDWYNNTVGAIETAASADSISTATSGTPPKNPR